MFPVKDKSSAIEILVNLHEKAGNLSTRLNIHEYKSKREEQGSTAVGEGIAIPHAKCQCSKKTGTCSNYGTGWS